MELEGIFERAQRRMQVVCMDRSGRRRVFVEMANFRM